MEAIIQAQAVPVSKSAFRFGLLVSAVPVLFLLFDAVIKLMRIGPVVESFNRLGYAESVSVAIGILELACLALYVAPRTSILGAVLLTGYLGGAIATHVRVGDPLLTHVLFPVYVGALLWGGLLLREARVRTLILFRGEPGSV